MSLETPLAGFAVVGGFLAAGRGARDNFQAKRYPGKLVLIQEAPNG